MLAESSEALDLIGRIQRFLAILRLWVHESRGRLDVVFLEISAVRVHLRELQEARSEAFRTYFNFNSRLQAVEDDLEEASGLQATALRELELRISRVTAGVLLLFIILLHLGRLLWDCVHDAKRSLGGSSL